jgi:hypothetical protein
VTVRVVEPPPGRGRTPRHPWGQPLRASLAVSAAGSPDRPRRPGGGWRFCGGVPRRLVVDNLKAVVTRADRLRSRSRASSSRTAILRLRRRSRCPAPCHREPKVERRIPYVRQDFFRGEQRLEQAGFPRPRPRALQPRSSWRARASGRPVPRACRRASGGPANRPLHGGPRGPACPLQKGLARDHADAVKSSGGMPPNNDSKYPNGINLTLAPSSPNPVCAARAEEFGSRRCPRTHPPETLVAEILMPFVE